MTYKLNQHQHIPEIVQQLQRFDEKLQQIQFSTSLIPLNRGIVATVYCKLKEPLTREELAAIYRNAIRINLCPYPSCFAEFAPGCRY